jgi:hypothetical protein
MPPKTRRRHALEHLRDSIASIPELTIANVRPAYEVHRRSGQSEWAAFYRMERADASPAQGETSEEVIPVRVQLELRGSDLTADERLDEMVGRIQRAVLEDRTRGGWAQSTHSRGWEAPEDAESDAIFVATILFEMRIRSVDGDPFAPGEPA